jgi:hypothetical protein
METRREGFWHTIREYVTHWTVAGAFLAATGAAPEHWVADVMHHLPMLHERFPWWSAHVDYRLVAVIAGLTIIVGDTVWRNHRRREPISIDASVRPELTDPPSIPEAASLKLPTNHQSPSLPLPT